MSSVYLQLHKGRLIRHKRSVLSKKNNTNNPLFNLIAYSNIGFNIVVPILIGLLIGKYVDNIIIHSNIGTIIGILAGTLFSFIILFSTIKKIK